MLTVQVSDITLSYAESGKGPDTVFVHGIPTDYRAWNAQIAPFSKSYHVITFSRRHAQPNDNPGSLRNSTIEANAKDLEELIRATTSPPVNLIGHSYGGFIAAYLTANHNELVKRLILIEPGISTMIIRDPGSISQMLTLLLRAPTVALAAGRYIRLYYNPLLTAYRKGDLDTSLRYFLDGLMSKAGALEQLPESIQVMVKENARTIGELEAELPAFAGKDAERISAPTLLVNGSNGTKIFRAINKRLVEAIPNSELVMIPDSSHFPHFENSGKFNQIALDFLART